MAPTSVQTSAHRAAAKRPAAMEVDCDTAAAAAAAAAVADFEHDTVAEFEHDTATDFEHDTAATVATPQAQLHAYAASLSQAAQQPEHLRAFEQLRTQHPGKFAELCKVHLSFLIDVPSDFLEEDASRMQQRKSSASMTRWLGLCEQRRSCSKLHLHTAADANNNSTAEAATAQWLQSAEWLLSCVCSLPADTSGLHSEGLFRKSGSVARQRRLREAAAEAAMGAGACWQQQQQQQQQQQGYSAHDAASSLKSCLSEQALLTQQLVPYFQQVARLQAPDPQLLAAKQLKGFRLLVQLLPLRRRQLLARLLALLHQVAAVAATRMTQHALGTVFGPLLLYPAADLGITDLRDHTTAFNSAAAFLIQHADDVFQPPATVCADAARNLRQLSSSSRRGSGDSELSVSVRFADGSSCQQQDGGDFTRRQVASLFAAVHGMPDSAKKRLLIRKFNRTNGGLSATQRGFVVNDAVASSSSSSSSGGGAMKRSSEQLFASISSPLIGRIDFAAQSLSPRQQH